MRYKLEDAVLNLFIESNKEPVIKELLECLELTCEDYSKSVSELEKNPNLRSPKNFRSFSYLEYQIKRNLNANAEYVFNKLLNSTKKFCSLFDEQEIRGSSILDLGCGKYDPLLQSMVLYVNGAAEVTAIDIEDCVDYKKASFYMLELLKEMLIDPLRWNILGLSDIEFKLRCEKFDVAALKAGNLKKAIQGTGIKYIVGDARVCLHPKSMDLIFSFSVLEHIERLEFRSFIKFLNDSLKSNGKIVSQIDFTDHRQHISRYNCWSFMCKEEIKILDEKYAYFYEHNTINQLRASQVQEILEESGFEIKQWMRQTLKVPEDIYAKFKEEYKKMKQEDLETIAVWMVAEKSK